MKLTSQQRDLPGCCEASIARPTISALSLLELKAGVIEGYWLPRSAKQAAWMVAQLPPADVKSLLDLMGNMTPSSSTLARLPGKISKQWEQHLEPFETLLAENITVSPDAVTVAATLDGVMLPMKDGKRQEKREKIVADGKRTRGPAACQEVSCGTLSFYDDQRPVKRWLHNE